MKVFLNEHGPFGPELEEGLEIAQLELQLALDEDGAADLCQGHEGGCSRCAAPTGRAPPVRSAHLPFPLQVRYVRLPARRRAPCREPSVFGSSRAYGPSEAGSARAARGRCGRPCGRLGPTGKSSVRAATELPGGRHLDGEVEARVGVAVG